MVSKKSRRVKKTTTSKNVNAVAKLNKDLMKKSVEHIATQILSSKASDGERTVRGFAENLLQEGRKVFPKLNMNMINYCIRKLKKKKITAAKELPVVINIHNIHATETISDVSSLTSAQQNPIQSGAVLSSSVHVAATGSSSLTNASATRSSSSANGVATGTSSSANGTVENDTNYVSDDKRSTAGRPKGTTDAAAKSMDMSIELATKEAAEALALCYKKLRCKNQKLPKGSLDELIEAAKQKHGVPEDVIICKGTIRQRVKRGSNNGHVGQQSPMLDVEPYLVELIIKLAEMRTPITMSQGLQLANSLIKGSKTQDKVVKWKEHNCQPYRIGKQNADLGAAYWQAFLKRNRHHIRTKKAVKFDDKRSQWCNYLNMEEMYTQIYKDLCNTGLAVEHDVPVWRNEHGDIVETEKEAVGCKSPYELIHPEWVLFVDECGSNTPQTNDTQVGGQMFLCSANGRPQQ
jgi:hypothetical protein